MISEWRAIKRERLRAIPAIALRFSLALASAFYFSLCCRLNDDLTRMRISAGSPLLGFLIGCLLCAAGVTTAAAGTVEDLCDYDIDASHGGAVASITIEGEYAYVGCGEGGLAIFELRDPDAPVRVGGIKAFGPVNDVVVVGDIAYLAAGTSGLQLVDVSDPHRPRLRGRARPSIPEPAMGVACADGLVYVAADRGEYAGRRGRIYVVDPSNPDEPEVIGMHEVRNARDIAVWNGFASVTTTFNHFVVYDLRDPSKIVEVGRLDEITYDDDLIIRDGIAYMVQYDGIRIVDVRDPAHPTQILTFDTHGRPQGLAVAGDYVYVSEEAHGMMVVDVSDLEVPSIANIIRLHGANAWDVEVKGDRAYVVGRAYGLQVIDIADPVAPRSSLPSISCARRLRSRSSAIPRMWWIRTRCASWISPTGPLWRSSAAIGLSIG